MAKQTITTEEHLAAHWIRQAEQYDRYAAHFPKESAIRIKWQGKAAEAREEAKKYSSPASGEAQTVAN